MAFAMWLSRFVFAAMICNLRLRVEGRNDSKPIIYVLIILENAEELPSINETLTVINSQPTTAFRIQEDIWQLTDMNVYEVFDKACRSPTHPWSTMMDLTAPSTTCLFRDLADRLDIPYVSASGYYCRRDKSHHVLTRPDQNMYMSVFLDVIFSQNVTVDNIVIFLDKGFENVNLLIPNERLPHPVESLMFDMVNDANRTSDILKMIRKDTRMRDFIVAGNLESIRQLLQEASKVGFLSPVYHWYVLTKDLGDLMDCKECGNASIVLLKHIVNEDHFPNFLQYSPNKISVLYTHDTLHMVTRILQDMFQGSWSLRTQLRDCFNETVYPTERAQNFSSHAKGKQYEGTTGSLYLNQDSKNANLTLSVNHVYFSDGKAFSHKSGTWNSINGLELENGTLLDYQIRPTLRVLTLPDPPFVFKVVTPAGVQYSGYSVDILQRISEKLNINFELFEPADGLYGVLQEDGTWSGAIGELVAENADMICAPLSVTAERDEYIDFTIPYFDFAGIQLLMTKTPEEKNLFKFVTVFELSVWLCILAVLVLTCILLHITDRFSPFSYWNTNSKNNNRDGKVFTMKESMWFVLGSYAKSGDGISPRSLSGRLLVAGFWFFCSIMMSMYTANLAAFLTVSRMSVPVESLDGLAEQTTLKYSTVADTTMQEYFKRMATIESNFYTMWKDMSLAKNSGGIAVWEYPLGDKYTNIWKSMKETGFLNSSEDGLRRVRDGNFVFLHETPMIKYETTRNCDLTAVGEQFSAKPYALALQENSPLTKQISSIILQLQKDRVLEDLKVKWWEKDKADCPYEEESYGISLGTSGGVFIFMSGGIVLGMIALVAEILWAKFNCRNDQVRSASTDKLASHDQNENKPELTEMQHVGRELTIPTFYLNGSHDVYM